jgi:hypothetical protein
MKSALFLLFISVLLCLSLAQRYPTSSSSEVKPIYKPFTQEEMKEYMPKEEDQIIVIDDPVEEVEPVPKGPHHRKKHDKHGKRGDDQAFEMPLDANGTHS